MPGKRGIPLSDEQKERIRAYIDSQKLLSTPRETLAAMILANLGIEVSGVSAAKIRREAFEDKDLANSQKEANIRSVVLETVEVEAPKVLGYIQDEIEALRSMAYGDKKKGLEPEEMSVTERVRVSGGILASCKTLIDIIGPPKPDRHITTTLEIMETADVSEYMKYGDKDDPGPAEMEDSTGDQET
jgi:hypothetical protein